MWCGGREKRRRTEAGLVGDDVPWDERDVGAEAVWAFVDVQVGAEAMASAVLTNKLVSMKSSDN